MRRLHPGPWRADTRFPYLPHYRSEGAAGSICEFASLFVAAMAAWRREAVVETVIVVERHVRIGIERLVNLLLRGMIDEMILGRDMHHQRVRDRMSFVQ